MEDFLIHLKNKNYQKRTVGIVENGSWAPCAAKVMKSILETMKDITFCDTTVTIKSTVKDSTVQDLESLASELVK